MSDHVAAHPTAKQTNLSIEEPSSSVESQQSHRMKLNRNGSSSNTSVDKNRIHFLPSLASTVQVSSNQSTQGARSLNISFRAPQRKPSWTNIPPPPPSTFLSKNQPPPPPSTFLSKNSSPPAVRPNNPPPPPPSTFLSKNHPPPLPPRNNMLPLQRSSTSQRQNTPKEINC